MRRGLVVGTIAAIAMGGALMAIDAHDFAQEPPTDAADGVATVAGLGSIAIRLALRRVDTAGTLQLIRVAAAGIAFGAIVVGLASVVYDPFAN